MPEIHRRFMNNAYSKLRAALAEDDDGTEPILCTCGEDVAGLGIPYYSEAHHHTSKNCPWYAAQMAEYERLCSGNLWVNVYLHDRAYGGPEEGGWYYDTYELRLTLPTRGLDAAQEIVRRLESSDEFSNEGRRDISSVLSEGVWEIRIEDRMGRSEPTERPYYE